MRMRLRTILLAALAACASGAVWANGVPMSHGTPYGPLYRGYEWDWWWLVIPTVAIEYIFLLVAFRPKKPGRFALIVTGVHLVSYPITVLVSVYLLFVAEILAVVIEYQLYKRIHTRLANEGGMGRKWRGKNYPLAMVCCANLLSFVVGAVLFFGMHPTGANRASVSRAKADMRSLATAIEGYMVDSGRYPPTLDSLTTPTAYIRYVPTDRMSPRSWWRKQTPIKYFANSDNWLLWSAGPDADYDLTTGTARALLDRLGTRPSNTRLRSAMAPYTYDPTNSARSGGDVWRMRQ